MIAGVQVGSYRVLNQIGEGGMGSVWLAEHLTLGRRAAIKVLHAEFSNRAEIVTRFFNEARAATAIADPGIVQIFDFGQHTDGSAYIVMELLDGEPLDKRLQRHGALAPVDALRIMRQVASTLGAAHARGIIHRDLKPENIFLVRDPEVPGGERAKVLDFGIAKLVGDSTGVKTQTSAMMGTPTYMSPEQCRGAGQVDPRSDVYALGCVLFALLVGQPPFSGEGLGDLILKHMQEPPPTPSQLRPGIAPEVDALVLRCLAKDPAQRFANAGELAIAIGSLVGSSPNLSAAPMSHAAGPYVATISTLSSANGQVPTANGQLPAATPRRRTGVMIAAVAVVGAAGAAIAVVATRGGDHPAAAHAEEPPATAPPPAPRAPDPNAEVAARMKTVLAAFSTWARDHAGAPCPEAAALPGAPADPWGHPFRITCTDQPGDQIVGAVSSGPDGVPGTADDVTSWQLGREVADGVRGPRWVVAPPPPPVDAAVTPVAVKKPTAATKPSSHPAKTKPTAAKSNTPPAVQLDENGMPISR